MSDGLGTLDAAERQHLVDLLHEAAKLEHCLLDTYLFAACSVKTLPWEFAKLGNGQDNLRRAVQFERVRRWKLALLQVAREEMLHLHYVQCMLRALGEGPYFELPDRDSSGTWVIANWQPQVGIEDTANENSAQVPVAPLCLDAIKRFVQYESTDSLQDSEVFGPAAMNVFDKLREFELDYHLESALLNTKYQQHAKLKRQLRAIYKTRHSVAGAAASARAAAAAMKTRPKQDAFQSIADLYLRGILPLYQDAFDNGWVVNNDRDLNNELQNPQYAEEGLLPVQPVYRDKNFEKKQTANITDPMRRFRNVRQIIQEIVSEGEGAANFLGRASAMLDEVGKRGGARRYLKEVLADDASPSPTPHWLKEYQRLRMSHLYRFAVILSEYGEEMKLAGADFCPARAPLKITAYAGLAKLCHDLPGQLNAAYLVLVSWLSRIYETKDRRSDQSRRYAIEMLASWPLMSTAIRPLLELVSFFPVTESLLFRLDATGLQAVPFPARELLELYQSESRSQQVRDRMDRLAVRVLSGVAEWAHWQIDTVKLADLAEPAKLIILTRLRQLAQLTEVERQFKYRMAGGYSDRMPDLTYQQEHPHSGHFEEKPATQEVIFDGFVLRFRFAGWGRVQLATDPDPPMDEAGCTGTHMLHAADGDLIFDRALVWQPGQPNTFKREPEEVLPKLGVNGRDVSLFIASPAAAAAGYVPINVMQPTSVADPSDMQYTCNVTGLNPVMPSFFDASTLQFDLLTKDGIRPFLNGMNHIISQDGEPIDPFILSVSKGQQKLFEREVYNEGKTLLHMHPLERLESSRQPCGFDSFGSIPDWARAALSDEQKELMADPAFPQSYLWRRCRYLTCSLEAAVLDGTATTKASVDRIISLAERLALLGNPPRPSPSSDPPQDPTTKRWLTCLLHYGHTLSGDVTVEIRHNPVLEEIAKTCGVSVRSAIADDRTKPNARWLVTYAKGVMDTDALSDFVYGELYVPLAVSRASQRHSFDYRWSLPGAANASVKAYACRFAKPFWLPAYQFDEERNERSYKLSDGTDITETCVRGNDNHYTYKVKGHPVRNYECSFSVPTDADDYVQQVVWTFSFSSADPGDITRVVAAAAADAASMLAALKSRFSPS
jgi:hypothetical protein